MATGFLDAYESRAERQFRRAQIIKRAITIVLVAGAAATIAYFSLRTRSQEQVVQQFLTDLESQKYQEAYKLWGCTPESPCKYYSPDKFAEDWGPSSQHSNPSAIKIEHVDYCSDGVVFDLAYPNSEDIGLWVQRSNNVISFAPWSRCPGRHLQLGAFLKSLFS